MLSSVPKTQISHKKTIRLGTFYKFPTSSTFSYDSPSHHPPFHISETSLGHNHHDGPHAQPKLQIFGLFNSDSYFYGFVFIFVMTNIKVTNMKHTAGKSAHNHHDDPHAQPKLQFFGLFIQFWLLYLWFCIFICHLSWQISKLQIWKTQQGNLLIITMTTHTLSPNFYSLAQSETSTTPPWSLPDQWSNSSPWNRHTLPVTWISKLQFYKQ